MKKVKAVFDESKDGFTYVPPGTYPMNIISFGVKDINDSKVFNMKFRVADEVSKLKVAKTIKNGDGGFTTAKSDKKLSTTSNFFCLVEILFRGI